MDIKQVHAYKLDHANMDRYSRQYGSVAGMNMCGITTGVVISVQFEAGAVQR